MTNDVKKRKSKRLNKSEEEKRMQILNNLLDKWVCVKNHYGDEEEYFYVKHLLGKKGKTTRIIQIIISGNEEQDGLYEISDYDLGFVFDAAEKKKMIDIQLKKYDQKYGLFSEHHFAENYNQLLEEMINKKYVKSDELYKMLKVKTFHNECEEVVLSFVRNYRNLI